MPPTDWNWHDAGQVQSLKYTGKKPIPSRVSWQDGFGPMLDPVAVVTGASRQVMRTFTREFFHPIPTGFGRCLHQPQLGSIRITGAFLRVHMSMRSALWCGVVLPGGSTSLWSQLMGTPYAAVASVSGDAAIRRQTQNS